MSENLDVIAAISKNLKVQCMYAGNLVVIGRDMLCLSNLLSDVVLIGMTYCDSVLLHEIILSSEFSMT
jgi:hypothetical protein